MADVCWLVAVKVPTKEFLNESPCPICKALELHDFLQVQHGGTDGGQGGRHQALGQGGPDLLPHWLHSGAVGGWIYYRG